jgi:hypothetical protein
VLGVFEIESDKLLSRLASNRDPPDVCLLSKQDYRQEPPVPGKTYFFVSMHYMNISSMYLKLLYIENFI